jgi:hypothetical protein
MYCELGQKLCMKEGRGRDLSDLGTQGSRPSVPLSKIRPWCRAAGLHREATGQRSEGGGQGQRCGAVQLQGRYHMTSEWRSGVLELRPGRVDLWHHRRLPACVVMTCKVKTHMGQSHCL